MASAVPPRDVVAVDRVELQDLCRAALTNAGASARVAQLLTEAALFAEDQGKGVVGVAHLLDHVSAMVDGRLDGQAVPRLSRPAPAVVVADACAGIAHTGFDDGSADLVEAARRYGTAVFTQHGSFTCGQLGWFTERLAAAAPGTGRVLGTNPLAYSVPRPDRRPFTVDQASSSTAFVAVRDAAARGDRLPEGWAVDEDGRATTDPAAALTGALLPFGGYRGANIALLVELLSSMAGGSWSMDAPPWDSGASSPSIGMFVLAVDPGALGGGFPARADAHLRRLADSGVRLPGSGRVEPPAVPTGHVALLRDVLGELRRSAG